MLVVRRVLCASTLVCLISSTSSTALTLRSITTELCVFIGDHTLCPRCDPVMCFPFHPLRRCSLFAPDSSSSNVFNKLWILAPPCHCFRPLGTPRHDVKFKCLSLGLAFKAFLHTWEKEAFNYVCDVAGVTSLPMHSAQLIMFVISNLAVCATTKLQSCSCIFSESKQWRLCWPKSCLLR